MTSHSELIVTQKQAAANEISAFTTVNSFESAQRMANALCKSQIVPKDYQNNISNCLVALEISQRTGSSVLAVMQSLHIIHGRPSWSASYIIGAINACGRFAPLRFDMTELGEKETTVDVWFGEKPNRQKRSEKVKYRNTRCVAWTTDRSGERLESPPVSVEMAVLEGWYTKNDSKWKTMPELMLRYRAAAFFGRLYAPDVLMGMNTQDEMIDVTPVDSSESPEVKETKTSSINERIRQKKQKRDVESSTPNIAKEEVVEAITVSEVEVVEVESHTPNKAEEFF